MAWDLPYENANGRSLLRRRRLWYADAKELQLWCFSPIVRFAHLDLTQFIAKTALDAIHPFCRVLKPLGFRRHFLLTSPAVACRLSRHFRPLRQLPCST